MHRVVLDTNALISALIAHGKPRELWNNVLDNKLVLVTSEELLEEFEEVSNRQHLKKYISRRMLMKFKKILYRKAVITKINERFYVIKEDEDDNIVLATAISGRADYIVSGDKHLLGLKQFKGIKIVNIDEMLKILNA